MGGDGLRSSHLGWLAPPTPGDPVAPTVGDPVAPMPDDFDGTPISLGEVAKEGLDS
jgi:hypothetical protein